MGEFTDAVFEKEKIENPFVKEFKIPLGTVKPLYSYRGPVPPEDIVFLNIDKAMKEQQVIYFIAQQGYLKTVLQKRLSWYFHNLGYKQLVFDPKGYEWEMARREGSGRSLLSSEDRDALPVKCAIPSTLIKKLGAVAKVYKPFSIKLSQIEYKKEFATLGFSPTVTQFLMSIIKMNPNITLEEILEESYNSRLSYAARDNLFLYMGNYIDTNFFDTNAPDFSVYEYWKQKEIPVIALFTPDKAFCSFIAGKILSELYGHEKKKKTPKFLFIDDAHRLIGYDMPIEKHMSVEVILDILTMGRFFNWNIVVGCQSATLLNEEIHSYIKYYLLGKIGNPEALAPFVGDPRIVKAVKELYYDPSKRIYQYCLVHPDRITYDLFFPLGPIVGHTW